MPASPILRALGADLWEAELHLQEGLHQRMRMTIVRRAGGGLWLHSPIAIDAPLADQLAALGEVRDILAPNRFHRRFAAAAKKRYPGAKLWAAPGLAQKKPEIPFDATLSEEIDWGTELQTVFLAGAPAWSEHVYFHLPSRTLICTDLVFNIRDESSALTPSSTACSACGNGSDPIACGAGWPRTAPRWRPASNGCWPGTSAAS